MGHALLLLIRTEDKNVPLGAFNKRFSFLSTSYPTCLLSDELVFWHKPQLSSLDTSPHTELPFIHEPLLLIMFSFDEGKMLFIPVICAHSLTRVD